MTALDERRYYYACVNVQDAISKACLPWPGDGSVERHLPYYGKPSEMLIHYVKYTVRLARKLGLYPDTFSLEHEAQRKAAA